MNVTLYYEYKHCVQPAH